MILDPVPPLALQSLISWLRNTALPFWADAGLDRQTGLFFETLAPQGHAVAGADVRMRVQFRQVYVYAHAAVLGLAPEGAALALKVWRLLWQGYWGHGGTTGFPHVLTATGAVRDSRRDSYDTAFAVLAAAWLHRACPQAGIGRNIEALLDFVDQQLTDEFGALREGVPDSLPYRQNPQMHWFEALLALLETGGHPTAMQRAERHRALMARFWFDSNSCMIGEYFTRDWQPAAGQAGQIVEPGHMAEWSWLLARHATLGGADARDAVPRLLAAARRFADPRHGLLVDEGLRDGAVLRGTRRCWLQTEWVKAELAALELGLTDDVTAACAAVAKLDHHYLRKPFAAGWIDQLDQEAKPVPGPVPTSILYHVMLAIIEADRVLTPRGVA
jgi:mannose/cellobiose epimerase-like protein (N-acyl-D-glucosamine 2-epimerase family)